MNASPNRVVAIATPLIFAPLAGAVSAFAATHAPGMEGVSANELQAVFIAGATIAVAKAGLWMKGWQDHEKRQEVVPGDAFDPANGASAMGLEPDTDSDPLGGDPEADMDMDADQEPQDDLLAELEAVLAEAADTAAIAKA